MMPTAMLSLLTNALGHSTMTRWLARASFVRESDSNGSTGQRRRGRPAAGAAGRPRGASLPLGSAAIGSLSAEPYRYTMADLEELTGLTPRTIRYYITQELLPPAKGRGVGATYGPTHLLRLQAVNHFKQSHMPLEEIRQRLEAMRDDDLAAMLHVETAPAEDRWRRILLHPDVELHVRERSGRDRDYALEKVVANIVDHSELMLKRELGEGR
jgi:DNA-binding transcriptional MerR regulator